jgi:hypothetical protein
MSAVAPVPIQTSDAMTVRLLRADMTELRRSNPQIALLGKIAPTWKIVQPLVVNLERGEDGPYIASDEIFFMYGEGDSVRAAVQDYVTALIEYYGLLSSHTDAPTVALFRFLQSYLQPIR